MDQDRIKGSIRQISGGLKAMAGRLFGDRKTEAKGNAEITSGKIENKIGGTQDTLRKIADKI